VSATNGRTVAREAWRPVPGFRGFEASSRGRVRSLRRGVRVLSQHVHNSRGAYLATSAARGKRWRSHLVHQLVALAFHGPPPGPTGRGSRDWQVNHRNGDRRDNRPENLEWVRHAENHRHASENGLVAVGESHGLTTLTEKEVAEIRARYSTEGLSQRELGELFGVTQTTVGRIVRRETWAHLP
jgi:hypothetical protein